MIHDILKSCIMTYQHVFIYMNCEHLWIIIVLNNPMVRWNINYPLTIQLYREQSWNMNLSLTLPLTIMNHYKYLSINYIVNISHDVSIPSHTWPLLWGPNDTRHVRHACCARLFWAMARRCLLVPRVAWSTLSNSWEENCYICWGSAETCSSGKPETRKHVEKKQHVNMLVGLVV